MIHCIIYINADAWFFGHLSFFFFLEDPVVAWHTPKPCII